MFQPTSAQQIKSKPDTTIIFLNSNHTYFMESDWVVKRLRPVASPNDHISLHPPRSYFVQHLTVPSLLSCLKFGGMNKIKIDFLT